MDLIPLGIQSNAGVFVLIIIIIIIIYLRDYNIALDSGKKSVKSQQSNSDFTLYTKGNGGPERLSRLNKVILPPSQECKQGLTNFLA